MKTTTAKHNTLYCSSVRVIFKKNKKIKKKKEDFLKIIKN